MKQGTLVILNLLKAAVVYHNRPVSYGDLCSFSKSSAEFPTFSFRRISEDVHRLESAGEVFKAGINITNNRGRFLYLFKNASISIDNRQTVTPAQIVQEAFNILWNERVLAASAEGVLPKPILTNDIYRHLAADNFKFEDKRTLPNTLLYLAQKNTSIRKLKRTGEHFTVWVPLGVADSELDLESVYGSNSERLATAVQRSVKEYKRPVCAEEVSEQIRIDPNLQVNSKASLAIQLNGLTKEKSYIKGKLADRHKQLIIRKAGQFNGKAYYFYGTKKDEIKYAPFVTVLNLNQKWALINAEKELEEIEACRLSTVAAGRALLVKAEAEMLLGEAEETLTSKFLSADNKYEVKALQNEILRVIVLAEEWIEAKNVKDLNLPLSVDTFTPGLTAKELLPIIKPFYPLAQEMKDANRLIILFHKDIRRIPNPNFRKRFSNNSQETSSFLFDKTDALLYIALNWGGLESSFQANLAKPELGNLRDVRFVIPALKSKSFDDRLSAVACLAFIQNEEAKQHLSKIMNEDSDHNIRQAANWAFEFNNSLADNEPSHYFITN